jgi:hypothetical protein
LEAEHQSPGSARLEEPAWLSGAVIHHVEGLDVSPEDLESVLEGIEEPALLRLKSNLHVARSRLLYSQGKEARPEVEEALEIDPRNPEALLLEGEFAWVDRQLNRARWAFSSCLQLRPADMRCLRGLILSFVEMDRVEQAQELVESWASSREADPDIRTWLEYAQGRRPGMLEAKGRDLDRARVSVELQRLQSGRDGAVEEDWAELHERLKEEGSPLQDSLLARMAALQELEQVETIRSEDETGWTELDDPWVLLALTRRALKERKSKRVEAYMDQMSRHSGESARVLFERASLLQDHDPGRAEDIWQRYLDLGPSGTRAQEVQGMGL